MNSPILVNRDRLHRSLLSLIPNRRDPCKLEKPPTDPGSFDALVSAFRVGSVWKTSRSARQSRSDEVTTRYVKELVARRVLEIGAGSGASSIDLMKNITNDIDVYFVSDICFDVFLLRHKGVSYFYRADNLECILRAGRWFIAYPPCRGMNRFLSLMASALLLRAPASPDLNGVVKVSLLNPELLDLANRDARVRVLAYNVLDEWPLAPVDLIKIGNLLILAYFNKQELRAVLANIRGALKVSGILALVENISEERASFFELSEDGKFKLVGRVNSGVAIEDFVRTGDI